MTARTQILVATPGWCVAVNLHGTFFDVAPIVAWEIVWFDGESTYVGPIPFGIDLVDLGETYFVRDPQGIYWGRDGGGFTEAPRAEDDFNDGEAAEKVTIQ
jgi:hypothetical protein